GQCASGKLVLDDFGHGIVRVGIAGSVEIDVNTAEIVGMDLGLIAEDKARGAYRTKLQGHLIVWKTQERANGLHVERRVNIPFRKIFRPAVRNDGIGTANASVDIRINVKKSGGGSFLTERAGQNGKIGFGALRQQTIGLEFLNQR